MELGGRKEIFVRAVKRMNKGDEGERGYEEYVFYKIDIETQDSGTLSTTCCPSLLNKIGRYSGRMLNLGSSIIYIIGTKADPENPFSKQDHDPSPDSIGSIACLQDAGWIDLSESDPKWRSAPCPTHNTKHPLCVPLSSKIYSLGKSCFKPEVYDHGTGTGGCWVELPPPPSEISGSRVSFVPVPDPQHDRILVYIGHSEYAIYTFEPNNDKQWKRLSPPGHPFLCWDMLSAIVDGVVCFAHSAHIQSIAAYDLADSARCLQVEWSNHSPYPRHLIDVEFDVLLNLGNGFLCLAVFTPLFSREEPLVRHSTRIYLAIFSLRRRTPDIVTFTYHYYRGYDLPDTVSVIDFLSLGNFHNDAGAIRSPFNHSKSLLAAQGILRRHEDQLYSKGE